MSLSNNNCWSFQSFLLAVLVFWSLNSEAQTLTHKEHLGTLSLSDVFYLAWQRQPEARSLQSRRNAAQSQAQAANQLTPEPPALEISKNSDLITSNDGVQEGYVGMAIPLWLPGQRAASNQLAQAEISFIERKQLASQLRLASAVRDAWWNWQRARLEVELANVKLSSAKRLAKDVLERTKRGDLAKSDLYQAEGSSATAAADAAQAQGLAAAAFSRLLIITGDIAPPNALVNLRSEPIPASKDMDNHPLLAELEAQNVIAESALKLIVSQGRANPELTIGAGLNRGSYGSQFGQAVFVGIRIPFGDGPMQDAKLAITHAELIEVQSRLALEKDRIKAEQRAAEILVKTAQTQLEAAQRRAKLANETQRFFEKSFRLGETDLPTRLRIESEAVDAKRLETLSRINLAAALSAMRQSLGLLPQ